jgi:CBS domain-containing protein
VLALLTCKVIIWVIALGSGTSGGVLAPLLMIGAGLGALAAPFMPGGEPALWPLVFMAATLGGMMRAPVMSVVFALELTHDVNAMLPLLAASAVAYGFTVLVMPRSILTEKIARRGYHIYREYGIDPLERHSVADVMTTGVTTIDAGISLVEALLQYFGADQRHRVFPVVRGDAVIGMLDRASVVSACETNASGKVGALFDGSVVMVTTSGENCRAAASRLALHGLERMPVVENQKSLRLVGIVSRSDLIKPSLALFDEEQRREKFRRVAFRTRKV